MDVKVIGRKFNRKEDINIILKYFFIENLSVREKSNFIMVDINLIK